MSELLLLLLLEEVEDEVEWRRALTARDWLFDGMREEMDDGDEDRVEISPWELVEEVEEDETSRRR